ncbi:hypothetical protein [Streptomyces albicerus]|uniref:hypothetical protein n=1 Tax=Streptomyces albicerus TaxID=2569859 RepID=UPI00124B9529|nr:hypothetical protein [Streptomyces albicerus]
MPVLDHRLIRLKALPDGFGLDAVLGQLVRHHHVDTREGRLAGEQQPGRASHVRFGTASSVPGRRGKQRARAESK